jgi:hypothetical protein
MMPIPDSWASSIGLLTELEVTCRVALLGPRVVGEKVTFRVQLVAGAMVGVRLLQVPGVTLNWVGFAPVMVVLVTVSDERLLLLSVKNIDEVVELSAISP